jgi:hypothetical protein
MKALTGVSETNNITPVLDKMYIWFAIFSSVENATPWLGENAAPGRNGSFFGACRLAIKHNKQTSPRPFGALSNRSVS